MTFALNADQQRIAETVIGVCARDGLRFADEDSVRIFFEGVIRKDGGIGSDVPICYLEFKSDELGPHFLMVLEDNPYEYLEPGEARCSIDQFFEILESRINHVKQYPHVEEDMAQYMISLIPEYRTRLLQSEGLADTPT